MKSARKMTMTIKRRDDEYDHSSIPLSIPPSIPLASFPQFPPIVKESMMFENRHKYRRKQNRQKKKKEKEISEEKTFGEKRIYSVFLLPIFLVLSTRV